MVRTNQGPLNQVRKEKYSSHKGETQHSAIRGYHKFSQLSFKSCGGVRKVLIFTTLSDLEKVGGVCGCLFCHYEGIELL
jgi:hypothetical protein